MKAICEIYEKIVVIEKYSIFVYFIKAAIVEGCMLLLW